MSPENISPQALAQQYFLALLGMILSCPFHGAAMAQAISYYRTYPKDPRYLKALVGLLVALETAHVVCFATSMKIWFLETRLSPILPRSMMSTSFFSISSFINHDARADMTSTPEYVIISIVQSSYAFRVWHISGKNKAITGIILLACLVQFVSGTGVVVNLFIGDNALSSFTLSGKIYGGTEPASSVLCDTMISASLVYFLSTNRTGLRRTENIIDRLIIYSVNVGLITSILALINIITWLTIQHNFDFLAIYFILTKIYVNSFFVTLNSRMKLRGDLTTGDDTLNLSFTDTKFQTVTLVTQLVVEGRFE